MSLLRLFSKAIPVLILQCSVVNAVYASNAMRISYKGATYDVFRISPRAFNKISFHWNKSPGNRHFTLSSVRESLKKRGRRLVFAMNAGIFKFGYTPLGLYIEKGRKKISLNLARGKGNFYTKPNGVFFIKGGRAGILASRHYSRKRLKPWYATQSGPILVRNNLIHRFFSRKSASAKIRNGVGVDRKGRVVFVISNKPVNMYRFAEFFKRRMQCANALYLDGTVSRMYLPAVKRRQLGGAFAAIIAVSEPK